MAGSLSDGETLLAQIEDACRRFKMAQSTFGRLAVNDGKFVTRLQQGGRVTLQTVERIHQFIADQGGPSTAALRSAIHGSARFGDTAQKHLLFVNSTNERQVLADRALEQLGSAQPRPPAVRLLDAGAGDGTTLARLLRGAHRRYPWLPFYVVAREPDREKVVPLLSRMADRLQEHPQTMLVVTNLGFAGAPWLKPADPIDASALVWHEQPLEGTTAGEFEAQIDELRGFVDQHWRKWPGGGDQPARRTPAVLVLYRRDNKFALDGVLPRRGTAHADYDFILAAHLYPARSPVALKAGKIVAPLLRALRPSGRLMGVQGCGGDPGLELVRTIWPDEDPFGASGREALMDAVRDALGTAARPYRFHALGDAESLLRFGLTVPAAEATGPAVAPGTLMAAFEAATYVAQIDDRRVADALRSDDPLEAAVAVLHKHGGIWFNDETFIVSRRSELG